MKKQQKSNPSTGSIVIPRPEWLKYPATVSISFDQALFDLKQMFELLLREVRFNDVIDNSYLSDLEFIINEFINQQMLPDDYYPTGAPEDDFDDELSY